MNEGKLIIFSSIFILFIVYFLGENSSKTSISIPDNFEQVLKFRREKVKNSTLHAWKGYEKYAFGHDELKPVSNSFVNPFGGFGVTIIDSLDTLYLMNLTEEYNRARDHILKVNFKKNVYVGVFETTIRVLGGFLGAYTVTNDERFIQKAKEMAELLLPAFKTSSGMPYSEVNLKTQHGKNPEWHRQMSILSEVGSIQLEFKYLSHLLKDPKYKVISEKVIKILISQNLPIKGLYPNYINTEEGTFAKLHTSFGALGDSFYEYLLKQYVLTSDKEEMYLDLYQESIQSMKDHMLSYSEPNGMAYIAELVNYNTKVHKFDHLVCFMGGTLALGSKYFKNTNDLEIAKEITETCYKLYKSTKTGIGPEIVIFDNKDKDFNLGSVIYLLRPELVESLFYLYRITKDKRYIEMGWEIYQSIEKHCKTDSGYSEIKDVNSENPRKNDGLQSFFFSETLKYLYLLFSDESLIPLDNYVFNTEGHPFKIYS